MTSVDVLILSFAQAVVAGDAATASRLRAASPDLATAAIEEGAKRHGAKAYFLEEIRHYLGVTPRSTSPRPPTETGSRES